jgi:DNA end-binding protein Ku
MVLSTLYWPDEIRSARELDVPTEEPDFKPAEKLMAEQLVAAMTKAFDPTAYRDEYREALTGIIEAKVEGRETVAAPAAETTNLIDLMAALQASVAAATKARDAKAPISVSEAKAQKAARAGKSADDEPARTSAKSRTKSRTPAAAAADSASSSAEAEPERPARRRKSA